VQPIRLRSSRSATTADRAPAVCPEPVIDVGRAWLDAARSQRTGAVIAAFRRAAYIEVDAQVLALVEQCVPPGPLHARVPRLPALQVGERIEIDRSIVRVGAASWSLQRATAWRPAPVDAIALLTNGARLAEHLAIAECSPLASVPLAALVASSPRRLVAGLSGRGPGLTPSGDDALAGIFLVRALTGADRGTMVLLARAAPTHDIARAFLAAAARGECVEPVHGLIGAVAAGDVGAMTRWQAVLTGLGATSGCDLVLGVRLALQNGRSASQTACASDVPGFDQKCGRSVRKCSASPAFSV
jgi:Protein of unknown function (DUF2877)